MENPVFAIAAPVYQEPVASRPDNKHFKEPVDDQGVGRAPAKPSSL